MSRLDLLDDLFGTTIPVDWPIDVHLLPRMIETEGAIKRTFPQRDKMLRWIIRNKTIFPVETSVRKWEIVKIGNEPCLGVFFNRPVPLDPQIFDPR